MTFDPDNFLESILASLGRIDYVKPEEMPDVELYVDQVTSFLQDRLKSSKRNASDKVMTKTMVNNYAKNKLLPPPVKKKYSRDHIMMLIFIYYLKGILSINDIEKLLSPMNSLYFGNESGLKLEDIYSEAFALALDSQKAALSEDVREKALKCMDTFPDAEGKEGEYLKYFAFISSLAFDVYVKRLMIEKLIDLMPEEEWPI